jgi:hypothetical protein
MKKVLTALVGVVLASGTLVASEPIQLSLTPEIAIFDRSERIEGLALSIWGENPQSALALGIVNGSTGDSAGLSWAWILNYAGNLTGLQLGLINYAETATTGVQIGLVNLIPSNQWFSELPDELAPAMIFVNWRL